MGSLGRRARAWYVASVEPSPFDRSEDEERLRRRLGVPDDARTVLIFGETSHWDPNWLLTSEEYYQRRVSKILDEVLDELEREPRRVFSIESLFFLQLYWERRPERRELIRRLVTERRLRFTGTGVTTPDTLLPSTEAILRDYLHGQEWLRERGMDAEPRVAYLPDDFGHSPALPSILVALGFDRACVTRIDGMRFVGSDYRSARCFPLPGSSAHLLARELRTQDFVWRARDGSEVLCHWNAFTYFQGDMLAHVGLVRWMGITFGVPWRTGRHIAGRIDRLVKQLAPLSRTPYLFCPIGCDFNGPIPRLIELLDRYNRTHYPRTGVWVVNAGMDDHLALVDRYRARLPVLELDPNPYWMGFYASRPDAKRRINRTARKLVLAEKLSFPSASAPSSVLTRAWDLAVISNHHDFVTGTSPDRVYREEQLPWLREAEALADRVLANVRSERGASGSSPKGEPAAPPEWRFASGRLDVATPHHRLVLEERAGGCIVGAWVRGRQLLRAPANDLVAHHDSGGLWRMGHEYRGGTFRELARVSERPAKITAVEIGGVLEVTIEAELDRRPVQRRLWLRADSPVIRMQVEGLPRRHRTVTCRFPLRSSADRITMNVPGGVVERPMSKLYAPTFWPARSFAHVRDPVGGYGLAAFLGGPACVALTEPGTMEWVALRHAPLELAFGFLPLPAHPASGTEDEAHTLEYAVWLTAFGDFRDNALPSAVRTALRAALFDGAPDLDALANAMVKVDVPDVLVTALKPASRGEGVIARLRSYVQGGEIEHVRLFSEVRAIRAAYLCDARERDRAELPVSNGVVSVPIERAITSVRLLV